MSFISDLMKFKNLISSWSGGSDSGWISGVLEINWGGSVLFRKVGKIVYFVGDVYSDPTYIGEQLVSIPDGMTPSEPTNFEILLQDSGGSEIPSSYMQASGGYLRVFGDSIIGISLGSAFSGSYLTDE